MGPASLTTLQSIILTLTLPATFLFFYFLLKKDEEEDEVFTKVHHMRISHDFVKVLTGLQGVQIKMIQEQTGTKMTFQDSESKKDKVLVISGSSDGIRRAELLIRQLLKEHLPVVSEKIYVPRMAVKIILGINRESIRNISRTSRAKIILNRAEARAKEKPFIEVELRGTLTSIASAKRMILDMVPSEKNSFVLGAEGRTRCGDNFSHCFVTAVEHPGHFWIQKIDCNDDYIPDLLDDLMKEMNEYYNSEILDSHTSHDFNIGDMVALKLAHDNNWHRAEVKDVLSGDLILYTVDFGNTVIVSHKNVRPLSTDFLNLPFQAIECCLANVKPSGDNWMEMATKEFENLTSVGKWHPIVFKIIDHQWNFNKTVMSVILSSDLEGNSNIADQLVHKGYAHYHNDDDDNFSRVKESLKIDNRDQAHGSIFDLTSLSRNNFGKNQGLYEGACDHLLFQRVSHVDENISTCENNVRTYSDNANNDEIEDNASLLKKLKDSTLCSTIEAKILETTSENYKIERTKDSSSSKAITILTLYQTKSSQKNESLEYKDTNIDIYQEYPSVLQLFKYSQLLTESTKTNLTEMKKEIYPALTLLKRLRIEETQDSDNEERGYAKTIANIVEYRQRERSNKKTSLEMDKENEISYLKDAEIDHEVPLELNTQDAIFVESRGLLKSEGAAVDVLELLPTTVIEDISSGHLAEAKIDHEVPLELNMQETVFAESCGLMKSEDAAVEEVLEPLPTTIIEDISSCDLAEAKIHHEVPLELNMQETVFAESCGLMKSEDAAVEEVLEPLPTTIIEDISSCDLAEAKIHHEVPLELNMQETVFAESCGLMKSEDAAVEEVLEPLPTTIIEDISSCDLAEAKIHHEVPLELNMQETVFAERCGLLKSEDAAVEEVLESLPTSIAAYCDKTTSLKRQARPTLEILRTIEVSSFDDFKPEYSDGLDVLNQLESGTKGAHVDDVNVLVSYIEGDLSRMDARRGEEKCRIASVDTRKRTQKVEVDSVKEKKQPSYSLSTLMMHRAALNPEYAEGEISEVADDVGFTVVERRKRKTSHRTDDATSENASDSIDITFQPVDTKIVVTAEGRINADECYNAFTGEEKKISAGVVMEDISSYDLAEAKIHHEVPLELNMQETVFAESCGLMKSEDAAVEEVLEPLPTTIIEDISSCDLAEAKIHHEVPLELNMQETVFAESCGLMKSEDAAVEEVLEPLPTTIIEDISSCDLAEAKIHHEVPLELNMQETVFAESCGLMKSEDAAVEEVLEPLPTTIIEDISSCDLAEAKIHHEVPLELNMQETVFAERCGLLKSEDAAVEEVLESLPTSIAAYCDKTTSLKRQARPTLEILRTIEVSSFDDFKPEYSDGLDVLNQLESGTKGAHVDDVNVLVSYIEGDLSRMDARRGEEKCRIASVDTRKRTQKVEVDSVKEKKQPSYSLSTLMMHRAALNPEYAEGEISEVADDVGFTVVERRKRKTSHRTDDATSENASDSIDITFQPVDTKIVVTAEGRINADECYNAFTGEEKKISAGVVMEDISSYDLAEAKIHHEVPLELNMQETVFAESCGLMKSEDAAVEEVLEPLPTTIIEDISSCDLAEAKIHHEVPLELNMQETVFAERCGLLKSEDAAVEEVLESLPTSIAAYCDKTTSLKRQARPTLEILRTIEVSSFDDFKPEYSDGLDVLNQLESGTKGAHVDDVNVLVSYIEGDLSRMDARRGEEKCRIASVDTRKRTQKVEVDSVKEKKQPSYSLSTLMMHRAALNPEYAEGEISEVADDVGFTVVERRKRKTSHRTDDATSENASDSIDITFQPVDTKIVVTAEGRINADECYNAFTGEEKKISAGVVMEDISSYDLAEAKIHHEVPLELNMQETVFAESCGLMKSEDAAVEEVLEPLPTTIIEDISSCDLAEAKIHHEVPLELNMQETVFAESCGLMKSEDAAVEEVLEPLPTTIIEDISSCDLAEAKIHHEVPLELNMQETVFAERCGLIKSEDAAVEEVLEPMPTTIIEDISSCDLAEAKIHHEVPLELNMQETVFAESCGLMKSEDAAVEEVLEPLPTTIIEDISSCDLAEAKIHHEVPLELNMQETVFAESCGLMKSENAAVEEVLEPLPTTIIEDISSCDLAEAKIHHEVPLELNMQEMVFAESCGLMKSEDAAVEEVLEPLPTTIIEDISSCDLAEAKIHHEVPLELNMQETVFAERCGLLKSEDAAVEEVLESLPTSIAAYCDKTTSLKRQARPTLEILRTIEVSSFEDFKPEYSDGLDVLNQLESGTKGAHVDDVNVLVSYIEGDLSRMDARRGEEKCRIASVDTRKRTQKVEVDSVKEKKQPSYSLSTLMMHRAALNPEYAESEISEVADDVGFTVVERRKRKTSHRTDDATSENASDSIDITFQPVDTKIVVTAEGRINADECYNAFTGEEKKISAGVVMEDISSYDLAEAEIHHEVPLELNMQETVFAERCGLLKSEDAAVEEVLESLPTSIAAYCDKTTSLKRQARPTLEILRTIEVSSFEDFKPEYSDGLDVLNQLESGTKGAHVDDVNVLVSYIEGDLSRMDARRGEEKCRIASVDTRKRTQKVEVDSVKEKKQPSYSLSTLMMHRAALNPEYAEGEISEVADDVGFTVVERRKRKTSHRTDDATSENASDSIDITFQPVDTKIVVTAEGRINADECYNAFTGEEKKISAGVVMEDISSCDLAEAKIHHEVPLELNMQETVFAESCGLMKSEDAAVEEVFEPLPTTIIEDISSCDLAEAKIHHEVPLELNMQETVFAERCGLLKSEDAAVEEVLESLPTSIAAYCDKTTSLKRQARPTLEILRTIEVSSFDDFKPEYSDGLDVLNQLESGTKGAHVDDVNVLVSYIEGDLSRMDARRGEEKCRIASVDTRKRTQKVEVDSVKEKKQPSYSLSTLMMHRAALNPEYAESEISEVADDVGFTVVERRKRKTSHRTDDATSENASDSIDITFQPVDTKIVVTAEGRINADECYNAFTGEEKKISAGVVMEDISSYDLAEAEIHHEVPLELNMQETVFAESCGLMKSEDAAVEEVLEPLPTTIIEDISSCDLAEAKIHHEVPLELNMQETVFAESCGLMKREDAAFEEVLEPLPTTIIEDISSSFLAEPRFRHEESLELIKHEAMLDGLGLKCLDILDESNFIFDEDLTRLIQLHEAYYRQCGSSSLSGCFGYDFSSFIDYPCVENYFPRVSISKRPFCLSSDDSQSFVVSHSFFLPSAGIDRSSGIVTSVRPSLCISFFNANENAYCVPSSHISSVSFDSSDSFQCCDLTLCPGVSKSSFPYGSSFDLLNKDLLSNDTNFSKDENSLYSTFDGHQLDVSMMESASDNTMVCNDLFMLGMAYSSVETVASDIDHANFPCERPELTSKSDIKKMRKKRKIENRSRSSKSSFSNCASAGAGTSASKNDLDACGVIPNIVQEHYSASHRSDVYQNIPITSGGGSPKEKRNSVFPETFSQFPNGSDIDEVQSSFDVDDCGHGFVPLKKNLGIAYKTLTKPGSIGTEDPVHERFERGSLNSNRKKKTKFPSSSPVDETRYLLQNQNLTSQSQCRRSKENKIRSALRKLAQEDPLSRKEKLLMVADKVELTRRRK